MPIVTLMPVFALALVVRLLGMFMSLSTIIVSINAMLLRRVKLARNQPVTTTQGQIR